MTIEHKQNLMFPFDAIPIDEIISRVQGVQPLGMVRTNLNPRERNNIMEAESNDFYVST